MKRKSLPNLLSGIVGAATEVKTRAELTRHTVFVYVDDNGFFWTTAEEKPGLRDFLVGSYTRRHDIPEIGEALLRRLCDIMTEPA